MVLGSLDSALQGLCCEARSESTALSLVLEDPASYYTALYPRPEDVDSLESAVACVVTVPDVRVPRRHAVEEAL